MHQWPCSSVLNWNVEAIDGCTPISYTLLQQWLHSTRCQVGAGEEVLLLHWTLHLEQPATRNKRGSESIKFFRACNQLLLINNSITTILFNFACHLIQLIESFFLSFSNNYQLTEFYSQILSYLNYLIFVFCYWAPWKVATWLKALPV